MKWNLEFKLLEFPQRHWNLEFKLLEFPLRHWNLEFELLEFNPLFLFSKFINQPNKPHHKMKEDDSSNPVHKSV